MATRETHTVREFVEKSFAHVGIAIEWRGKGSREKGRGRRRQDWPRAGQKVDPRWLPPTPRSTSCKAIASKAKRVLGWSAETSFPELVRDMMDQRSFW